jgi:hypothetical protein
MPLNFSTGGFDGITRPPRIINVYDTFNGCPGANRTSPYMSATFTLARTSIIIIEGEIIRRRDTTSRCDFALYGPGYPNISQNTYASDTTKLDVTLDYNDGYNTEWDNACFRWMGYADAGTRTFYAAPRDDAVTCTSQWGCTSPWGQMHVIIFE